MKVGDLVIMLRPVVGAYDGFGIITSTRKTLPIGDSVVGKPLQITMYTVHWNDKVGNGTYWSNELEVISESR